MPAGPCTGAPTAQTPHGASSVAGPPGHRSLSGASAPGYHWCSRRACPTPRDYPREVVGNVQGYHSNQTVVDLQALGIAQLPLGAGPGPPVLEGAAGGPRRRLCQPAPGPRGRRLLRSRGELLERPFAHLFETGGMRRVHLRGHPNILKRLLVHVAGCNLGLLLRHLIGVGTPRNLQGRAAARFRALIRRWRDLWGASGALLDAVSPDVAADGLVTAPSDLPPIQMKRGDFHLGLLARRRCAVARRSAVGWGCPARRAVAAPVASERAAGGFPQKGCESRGFPSVKHLTPTRPIYRLNI